MEKKLWYGLPLFLIILLIGLIYWKGDTIFPYQKASLVGQYVPDFKAPYINPLDERLTSHSLKGHYTLLVFFASWCPHCHNQLPVLREIKYKNITLIGVNIRDDFKKFKDWYKKNPDVFSKIVTDPDNKLTKSFNVVGIPETYLINPEGKIIFNTKGSLTFKIMTQDILPLLPQS